MRNFTADFELSDKKITRNEWNISMNTEALLNDHMLAEATLTAHLLDVALKAGYSTDQINELLCEIANKTAISEIWISDESGRVVYTNKPDIDFSFGTDPSENDQSAEFAQLLTQDATAVVQPFMNRTLDAQSFKYVAVRGVDQARVVQIGIAANDVP